MAPLSCLMSLLTCAVLAVHHHHCCCHHLPPLTQSHPSQACPSSLLLLCAWVLPLLLAWHHLQLPSWQQVPFSLLTLRRTKAADSRARDDHVRFVITYRLFSGGCMCWLHPRYFAITCYLHCTANQLSIASEYSCKQELGQSRILYIEKQIAGQALHIMQIEVAGGACSSAKISIHLLVALLLPW